MPKPQIDLKSFQGLITTWFNNGLSPNDITKHFAEEYSTICKAFTIEQPLKE
jgi:hypothetical protein